MAFDCQGTRYGAFTFEQLHWARFFVNISKIKKKNVTYIFLENFLENSSYRKFIKNFFEKV